MNNRKPESFVKQPTYPGGKKALDEFVKQNLVYPEEALKSRVEGTVTMELDIDIYGKVIETKVKHGIGYGCDEEAVRIVKLLQYSKKKYRGLHVIFHQTINIHFKLPVPSQQSFQINYHYKESSKEKK